MPRFSFKDKDFFSRKGKEEQQDVTFEVITECYCHNGHSLLSDLVSYNGYPGLTVKLRTPTQEGTLSLSPIVGDKSRSFFEFDRNEGEIIQICCPTCGEQLPVYNECTCEAELVALFTEPKPNFANCIGICQRIGCLNSEILTTRALRLLGRNGFL